METTRRRFFGILSATAAAPVLSAIAKEPEPIEGEIIPRAMSDDRGMEFGTYNTAIGPRAMAQLGDSKGTVYTYGTVKGTFAG